MALVWNVRGTTQAYRPLNEGPRHEGPEYEEQLVHEFESTMGDHQKESHSSPQAKASSSAYKKVLKGPSQQNSQAIRVRQLMTRNVFALTSTKTVKQARELMRQNGFRHVPVICGDTEPNPNTIVGIVSERDLLRVGSKLDDKPISEIMSLKILTASDSTSIREIAGVMLKEKIGCVPIVDSSKQLIGVVTTTDILRSLWNRAPLSLWA